MQELQELYQALIMDHGRNPRGFGILSNANCCAEGFNSFCGDRLTLYIQLNKQCIIDNIQFTGQGCAISIASASLMAEHLKGKTCIQAHTLFRLFHQQVTFESEDKKETFNDSLLGKLTVLSGVKAFPSRVKCATLAWHTLKKALSQSSETATTEKL